MNHKKKTITEFFASLSIIGVLAIIMLPLISSWNHAASNRLLITKMKNIGQGMLQYTMDYNDRLPPTSANCNALIGPCTKIGEIIGWQDIIKVYVADGDVYQNPKRATIPGPFPAGSSGEPARFRRLQHFGMPARAAYRPNVWFNGYFEGVQSGRYLRYDGIGGHFSYGFQSQLVPSYKTSQIKDTQEIYLFGESGSYDLFFEYAGSMGNPPLRSSMRYSLSDYNVEFNGIYHAFGITTSTKHEADPYRGYRLTSELLIVPIGLTSYVTIDGNVRTEDYRTRIYNGSPSSRSSAYFVIKALNPTNL